MDDNATPTVVRYLGRLLGLTETQTAWRWRGWQARVASVGRVLQPSPPAEAGAPRQVRCQHCRAVQIEADLVCSVCGKVMITRVGRQLRQWAHHVPSSINAAIVTLHVMVSVWLSTPIRPMR